MSFFSVPLSGLNASQSALQSISNNLANTNTDGYKDQNVTFSDVFSQSGVTNGALDPLQAGQGVNTASTTINFTDGNSSATGVSSNMALSGNGFFVVRQTNGDIAFSRAGDFTTNNAGQLVAPDGSLVLGYPAQGDAISTASLQPLQLGTTAASPAVATTQFSATVNLDATTAVNGTASSTINVYDSLGAPHTLTVNYTKTGTNAWSFTVTVPPGDLAPTSPVTTTPVNVGTGTLAFDTSGKLTTTTPVTINIAGYADGAADSTIKWNLLDTSGNPTISQADLKSGTSDAIQNGSGAGTLDKYSVNADGTVEGTFTNGLTFVIGQVAVATVINTQGLQQIGNNLFTATAGSGPAEIGIAGTGGRGTIKGGSVEGSNVNIAGEFSKMIVAQQAYQANAKVVTTFNQVEQATLNMLQG